jgi:pimeloyl-ACP methyl ester carboxylesterase
LADNAASEAGRGEVAQEIAIRTVGTDLYAEQRGSHPHAVFLHGFGGDLHTWDSTWEILGDGDTAHVVWAMQDRVVWGADRRPKMGYAGHTGYGHYHERYVRQDGRWRIAAQRLTRLHVDYYYEPPADAPVGQ